MSKNWYPVIDYMECEECGRCVSMCQHGVYDKQKHPTPVVIFPEGCIEGCKGCGNRCPAKAIRYVGDRQSADGGCNCCG